mgnify:CR=1 FL=1
MHPRVGQRGEGVRVHVVVRAPQRTGIGKAYRGGFNATLGPTLGSYSLKAAVERAGIEGGEIDDVLWGSALQQGTQGGNLARQVALRAGLQAEIFQIHPNRWRCAGGHGRLVGRRQFATKIGRASCRERVSSPV